MTETKSCQKAFHLLSNSCLINLRQGIHKLPIACEVSSTNIPLDHLQGNELSLFQFCLLTPSEPYKWHRESSCTKNFNNPLLYGCNPKISKGFLLWGVTETPSVPRDGSVNRAITFIPVLAAAGPRGRAGLRCDPWATRGGSRHGCPPRHLPSFLPHIRAGREHWWASPEEKLGEEAAEKTRGRKLPFGFALRERTSKAGNTWFTWSCF